MQASLITGSPYRDRSAGVGPFRSGRMGHRRL